MGDVRVDTTGELAVGTDDGRATQRFFPGLKISKITLSIKLAQMTDNADATGFIDFTDAIPANALVLGWKCVTRVGFAGDTTAVMKVGVAGALDDLSVVTTGSVLAAGTIASGPKTYALANGAAARTPRVTITGGADFTSITTGKCLVTIYYIDLRGMTP